jgi:hypothetical protein
VLVAAFAVPQTCQKSQIRVDEDAAIARAEREVEFEPTRKQVRLVRRGLNSKPYWVVSLSVPAKGAGLNTQEFSELAVVTIDANTGAVTEVKIQR